MKKVLLISLALLILVVVFIFQRFNYAHLISSALGFQIENPNTVFVVNKTIRLVLNDTACMLLIFALFRQAKYLTLAFYLFLVELFFLLPFYLFVKLSLEGDSEISSPLLSQVHRLIVNPLLMFLLIAGFIYQRIRTKNA